MKRIPLLAGVVILSVLLLNGCGSDDGEPAPATATAVPSVTPTAVSAPTPTPTNTAGQQCLASGGSVTTGLCCASAGDFPRQCGFGACGCAPSASREVQRCECGVGRCFDGSTCVSR